MYVSCAYDQQWWIGLVDIVNHDVQDVEIVFLYPHGPARSFAFPQREDRCIIPLKHILCKIKMPSTATGRQYTIDEDDTTKIVEAWNNFIE